MKDLKESQRKGYMAKSLIIATMPHSEPPSNEFQRCNGMFTLKMIAPKDIGLPSGTLPRVALLHILTAVVKTGSRVVYLGESLSQFMRTMEYGKSGGPNGTFPRMRDQLRRLFNATVSLHYHPDAKHHIDYGFRITTKAVYFWDNTPSKPETSWDAEITLTEEFFQEIINHPVPIDLNAIQALKSSSLALDIYMWLTWRVFDLREPITISWNSLEMQFGSDFTRTYNFKQKFIEQLKNVLKIYPVNLSPAISGLTLFPSATHIPKHL